MPDGILFFALSGVCFMAGKKFLRNLRKGVDNIKSICYTIYRNFKKVGQKQNENANSSIQ